MAARKKFTPEKKKKGGAPRPKKPQPAREASAEPPPHATSGASAEPPGRPERTERTERPERTERRRSERLAERSPHQAPLVTVFGAGITGLSVAHELIERGFEVQVVEPTASLECEYEVEVGGIAATQLGAVKEEVSRLHPHLFEKESTDYLAAIRDEEIDDPDVAAFYDLLTSEDETVRQRQRALCEKQKLAVRTLRAYPMQQTRPPLPLTETIRFESPAGECPLLLDYLGLRDPELLRRCGHEPDGPRELTREEFLESILEFEDEHGVFGHQKLDMVARKIGNAIIDRIERLQLELAAAERYAAQEGETVGRLADVFELTTLRREVLVVEVRGHCDGDLPGKDARAIGLLRARVVKGLLVERIEAHLRAAEPRRKLDSALQRVFRRAAGTPHAWHGETTEDFIQQVHRHLVAVSRGSDDPLGTPQKRRDRIRSNRVDFRVLEALLPGEHGYRYFPAYYRHLFDVMQRTPILDRDGYETGRTAFSQLVTPPAVGISVPGHQQIESIARRRFRSLKEVRTAFQTMVETLGISNRDTQLYFLRIFVFMTACRERRRKWGKLSWLEFLDGRDEHSAQSIRGTTRFSEGCEALLRETAQALVAMDAEETDACTYAQNSVQLLLDYQGEGAGTDMTLNGPTSAAWMRHWKAYLKRQGVRFFLGTLERLELNARGEVVPVATHELDPSLEKREPIPEDPSFGYEGHLAGGDVEAPSPDFYVLALPFDRAARIAWQARRDGIELDGDWKTLADMDAACVRRDDAGNDLVQYHRDNPIGGTRRDPETGHPDNPDVYPLRDLSGIQFFFPTQVRLGLGHLVYPKAKWGLTSISQVAHWRTRLSPRGAYIGQVSVDIGDFYEKHSIERKRKIHYLDQTDEGVRQALATPKTAWRCEWWEIAVRTWDQILETLDDLSAESVEPPRYYHLDSGLILVESPEPALYMVAGTPRHYYPLRLAGNATPFLINLPGQWEMRPGLRGDVADHGQKAHGGGEAHGGKKGHGRKLGPSDPWYRVSNGRWLLAGTYMATYTRMMTMEACNESARHAVRCILHELWRNEQKPRKYNSQGKLLGELCETFDPFDHEIDDLEPLKQLDAALFAEGLPHFVEILGIERLVELLPQPDREQPSVLTRLSRAFESTRRTYEEDWGFLLGMIDPRTKLPTSEMLRELRQGLERVGKSDTLSQAARAIVDFVRELRG